MSDFGKTLVSGAVAAASLPLSILALGSWLGVTGAVALHAVIAVAFHLAWLATGPRRRAAVFATVALLGALSAGASGSLGGLLVLLSGLVASVRSGWLFRRPPARALAVEAAVQVGALGVGWLLFSLVAPGPVGLAVVVWGWFVAQSGFFLVGELRPRRAHRSGDAFEDASRALDRLLADC
jgi:hypothetical protein